MKKIISLIIIFITIISLTTVSLAVVRGGARSSSARSTSSSVKSTSTAKSSSSTKNISGKTVAQKYNASNIKTEKVNSNLTYYKNYSSTNMFTPNFWMMMWAFQCLHDNTKQISEQDIAKELEERGYTQEEVNEILTEAKLPQEIALFTIAIGVGAVISIE